MTAQEANQLVQGIFDNIFNSVTQADSGGGPLMQASSTMLSLLKPGMAISSHDFANPCMSGVDGIQFAWNQNLELGKSLQKGIDFYWQQSQSGKGRHALAAHRLCRGSKNQYFRALG